MVITEGSFEGVDLRLSALSDSDVCVPVVMRMITGVSRNLSINDTNVEIPANSLMGVSRGEPQLRIPSVKQTPKHLLT